MSKKNKTGNSPFVYSTDPDFKFDETGNDGQPLKPSEQVLRIWLETKHRGGKAATVVKGFVGTDDEIEAIAKQLKNMCGSGGSAKDGDIIIQGDHRDKVLQWFLKNGYSKTKKAGA